MGCFNYPNIDYSSDCDLRVHLVWSLKIWYSDVGVSLPHGRVVVVALGSFIRPMVLGMSHTTYGDFTEQAFREPRRVS